MRVVHTMILCCLCVVLMLGGATTGGLWLPGAERVRNARSAGGSYIGVPWRFVFHTIEGEPSADGFRALAARHGLGVRAELGAPLRRHGGTLEQGLYLVLDKSG